MTPLFFIIGTLCALALFVHTKDDTTAWAWLGAACVCAFAVAVTL